MTQASNTPSAQSKPVEDFPLAISFLREDIQDLRQDMRSEIQGVRSEIQGVRSEVQDLRQDMHSEIQGVRQDMQKESVAVHGRIDELRRESTQQIDNLTRRMDSRFTWLMTTMVAIGGVMVTLLGVPVAILKT